MEQIWAQLPEFLRAVLAILTAGGIVWLVSQRAWPRLRIHIQKVSIISGEWESTFQEEEGVTRHEEVEVKQVGQKISGKMILRQEGGASIKSTFRGTIQGGVIKGLYESESLEGFEQGAFMLEINPGGNRAVGQYIYFYEPDEASAEITPVKYRWDRK